MAAGGAGERPLSDCHLSAEGPPGARAPATPLFLKATERLLIGRLLPWGEESACKVGSTRDLGRRRLFLDLARTRTHLVKSRSSRVRPPRETAASSSAMRSLGPQSLPRAGEDLIPVLTHSVIHSANTWARGSGRGCQRPTEIPAAPLPGESGMGSEGAMTQVNSFNSHNHPAR